MSADNLAHASLRVIVSLITSLKLRSWKCSPSLEAQRAPFHPRADRSVRLDVPVTSDSVVYLYAWCSAECS